MGDWFSRLGPAGTRWSLFIGSAENAPLVFFRRSSGQESLNQWGSCLKRMMMWQRLVGSGEANVPASVCRRWLQFTLRQRRLNSNPQRINASG